MIKLITLITKFIIATLMALLFSSCINISKNGFETKGSGNSITQSRPVDQDFKSLDVKGGIRVIVTQSENKSIAVKADDNLQEHIITKIEHGVLTIKSDTGYDAEEAPEVTVNLPEINGLSANSGALLKNNGVIITENINVKTSSGSKIEINIEADDISLESSSGSKIIALGKALKLATSSSSGSKIDARDLMTNEVVSQTSSGSKTLVYPILKLDAKASSGSKINYRKEPKTISKEESSGGSIALE
jgi:hypothetical protein